MSWGKDVLNSEEVRDLLNFFKIKTNPINEGEQFIEETRALDKRYKDGKFVAERYELEKDQSEYSDKAINVILRTAEYMRMCRIDDRHNVPIEMPLAGKSDLVIVLGGARRSNRERAMYAAQAMASGNADFIDLVVAGSSRKLKPEEKAVTDEFAPDAQTEHDLCVDAANFVIESYDIDTVISDFLIENEKAGTPDVIETVIADMFEKGLLSVDSSVAVITTQIYWLSTALDLRRVAAKFGITKTFVAGTPSPQEIIDRRSPATYLSEIVRTLRAAVMAATNNY